MPVLHGQLLSVRMSGRRHHFLAAISTQFDQHATIRVRQSNCLATSFAKEEVVCAIMASLEVTKIAISQMMHQCHSLQLSQSMSITADVLPSSSPMLDLFA